MFWFLSRAATRAFLRLASTAGGTECRFCGRDRWKNYHVCGSVLTNARRAEMVKAFIAVKNCYIVTWHSFQGSGDHKHHVGPFQRIVVITTCDDSIYFVKHHRCQHKRSTWQTLSWCTARSGDSQKSQRHYPK